MPIVYLSLQNVGLIRTLQFLCQIVSEGLLNQGQPDLSASSCDSASEAALHATGAPSGTARGGALKTLLQVFRVLLPNGWGYRAETFWLLWDIHCGH